MTKVLICPEAFSGGVTAQKAASLIADGLSSTSTQFQIQQIPLSLDRQTVATVVEACGGVWREAVVLGEQGRSVRVPYGLLHEGRTAVLAPYRMPSPKAVQNNVSETTSFGAGQLLKAALQEKTVERVYLYLSEGIWPIDGGVGFLQALGISLLDPDGKSVSWASNTLGRLTRVDFRGAWPRLQQVELIVGYDNGAPLLGRQGAAWTWGSKVGASFGTIEKLEKGLASLTEAIQRTHGGGYHLLSGAAGGGGLGYGLALVGAKLRPSSEVLLENLNLAQLIREAQLVLTGQAQTDRQSTPQQLAPSVLRLCQESGTPAVVLSGSVRPKELETAFGCGAWAVLDSTPGVLTRTESLEQVADNLFFSAQQMGRLLLLGKKLSE